MFSLVLDGIINTGRLALQNPGTKTSLVLDPGFSSYLLILVLDPGLRSWFQIDADLRHILPVWNNKVLLKEIT